MPSDPRAGAQQPAANSSGPATAGGFDYIVLRNISGVLAVYRVMTHSRTLKRLRRRGSSIALEAANPAYETRIFGPDRVRIQGKLVSLIRKY